MKSSHIEEYCELFEANFVEVGDKLFANCDFEASIPPGPPEQTTLEENTLNSERFYFFPTDTVEGVLSNHALASAVKVIWESRLAAQCPQRSFRCFVSNQYDVWPTTYFKPDTFGGDGVTSVLRLWSLPADDPGFDETYRVNDVAHNRVLWPEYDADRLVPLEEAFTIIRDGAHPAREHTFRKRWLNGQVHR